MREETNYYKNIETCPHYYPGDENDPYPGQPKTNHYSQNHPPHPISHHSYNPPQPIIHHSYNPPHPIYIQPYPNIHSNNRRQGEQIKAANKNCRRMTNKGNEARCDGNIEIRNESLEQLDQIRVACGNGRCDSGDFEMSSKKI